MIMDAQSALLDRALAVFGPDDVASQIQPSLLRPDPFLLIAPTLPLLGRRHDSIVKTVLQGVQGVIRTRNGDTRTWE